MAVDLLESDQDRNSHVHQRLEKKWLGSMLIPFSSLYHNTRIEGRVTVHLHLSQTSMARNKYEKYETACFCTLGTFRLHSPAVLLGYERTGNTANVVLGAGGGFGNTASGGAGGGLGGGGTDPPKSVVSKNATYLNIYLTIQVCTKYVRPVRRIYT